MPPRIDNLDANKHKVVKAYFPTDLEKGSIPARIVIGVSLNNTALTGNYLEAVLKLLVEAGVKEIILLNTAQLYRHNFIATYLWANERAIFSSATKLSEEWMIAHTNLIRKIENEYHERHPLKISLVSWGEFTGIDNMLHYQDLMRQVRARYQTDEKFQQSINASAYHYLSKNTERELASFWKKYKALNTAIVNSEELSDLKAQIKSEKKALNLYILRSLLSISVLQKFKSTLSYDALSAFCIDCGVRENNLAGVLVRLLFTDDSHLNNLAKTLAENPQDFSEEQKKCLQNISKKMSKLTSEQKSALDSYELLTSLIEYLSKGLGADTTYILNLFKNLPVSDLHEKTALIYVLLNNKTNQHIKILVSALVARERKEPHELIELVESLLQNQLPNVFDKISFVFKEQFSASQQFYLLVKLFLLSELPEAFQKFISVVGQAITYTPESSAYKIFSHIHGEDEYLKISEDKSIQIVTSNLESIFINEICNLKALGLINNEALWYLCQLKNYLDLKGLNKSADFLNFCTNLYIDSLSKRENVLEILRKIIFILIDEALTEAQKSKAGSVPALKNPYLNNALRAATEFILEECAGAAFFCHIYSASLMYPEGKLYEVIRECINGSLYLSSNAQKISIGPIRDVTCYFKEEFLPEPIIDSSDSSFGSSPDRSEPVTISSMEEKSFQKTLAERSANDSQALLTKFFQAKLENSKLKLYSSILKSTLEDPNASPKEKEEAKEKLKLLLKKIEKSVIGEGGMNSLTTEQILRERPNL